MSFRGVHICLFQPDQRGCLSPSPSCDFIHFHWRLTSKKGLCHFTQWGCTVAVPGRSWLSVRGTKGSKRPGEWGWALPFEGGLQHTTWDQPSFVAMLLRVPDALQKSGFKQTKRWQTCSALHCIELCVAAWYSLCSAAVISCSSEAWDSPTLKK